MAVKGAYLQGLFAKRREATHNRIVRTEAVKKYFDHWGKVTAHYENWTAPDYYNKAEQQLENTKQEKQKQKQLADRQEKLAQLLKMEKESYEQEIEENQNPRSRKMPDTKTLEKINENLEDQRQIRRKLDLEAQLYGKWRHGVDDKNLLFESKTDNQVLAKLNWLDKQVHQQMEREKTQEAVSERQLKLQQELNRAEELHKERQEIREKEIHEIRSIQEHHLEQLKERQKETDCLKDKEKELKVYSNELTKELELLEESHAALNQIEDFGDAYNFNKIKLFTRKRSEEFRNNINLCLSITERCLHFAEKPEVLKMFKESLQHQLDKENEKLTQLEGMYESEAKFGLRQSEQMWQQEHTKRYKELNQILNEELRSINTSYNDIMKRQQELLDIRATHMKVIENSSEKIQRLMSEEQKSPRYKTTEHEDIASNDDTDLGQPSTSYQLTNNIIHSQLEESADTPLYSPRREKIKSLEQVEPAHEVDFSSRRNCSESDDNCMSPIYNDVNRMSDSFNNLNLDVCQTNNGHPSKRDLESRKTNSQRTLQVVTSETEADRPRFGRKHLAWN